MIINQNIKYFPAGPGDRQEADTVVALAGTVERLLPQAKPAPTYAADLLARSAWKRRLEYALTYMYGHMKFP